MDFWHCHKPDEHHLHNHTHEEAIGAKGYAAGNRLEAAAGIGFVDLTSFLLKEVDCEGAEVRHIITSFPMRDVCQCFPSASGRKEGDLAFPWHYRRYKRPRVIGSYTSLSAGRILLPVSMDRWCCGASGQAIFHCRYTLRLLGLTGFCLATFLATCHWSSVMSRCHEAC